MKAYLEYIGMRTEIHSSEFAFYRNIKPMGNLATRVLGGSLRVGMESSATSMRFLEELLKIDPQFRDTEQADPANADCFKEVTLQIYQDDGHPFRTYRLLDGHIANFSELFSATHRIGNTDSNHLVYIAFASATQVINDSTKNQFEWYITPFKPKEYQPAVKAFEGEEAKVLDYYITDLEGTRISDTLIGQEIILHIISKNLAGKTITISLDDKQADFKRNGTLLKEDTIKDYTIQKDHDTIKLEVVKPQNEET